MVISSKKKTNPRSCPDITLCGAKIGTSNVKYIMASQDSGKVATASKDKWREQVKKAVLSHWEKHWKMRWGMQLPMTTSSITTKPSWCPNCDQGNNQSKDTDPNVSTLLQPHSRSELSAELPPLQARSRDRGTLSFDLSISHSSKIWTHAQALTIPEQCQPRNCHWGGDRYPNPQPINGIQQKSNDACEYPRDHNKRPLLFTPPS